MAFVYDIIDMAELQGYVRRYATELENDQFTLRRFLPNQNIDDIEYRVTRSSRRDQDAATVRAWDAESSIASRQVQVEKLMGELPPISRKIRLGEEERLRRRARESGSNAGLVQGLYADAGNMARAVTARVEMLRGELLVNAAINIDEHGVKQTVDFGRDANAVKTAAGATRWADPAAEVLTELATWRQEYIEMNDGTTPEFLVCSERLINALVFNEQIHFLARGDVEIAHAPPIVSPGTVQSVLSAYGLPTLVPYDVKVRVNGTQQRVIDDHIGVLLPGSPTDHGESLFGTTAEALELVDASQLAQDQAPGLTAVIDKTTDPVSTWTKCAAVGLPVLYEPNLGWRLNLLVAS